MPILTAVKVAASVEFTSPTTSGKSFIPPVFKHALKWLRENENYVPDIIVHLRPTGPMLRSYEIDEAIELLEQHPDADSVRSIEKPPKPFSPPSS